MKKRTIIVKDLSTGLLIPIKLNNHKIEEINHIKNKTIAILTIATLINSISILILALKHVL